jgi:hypothetical protein
LLAKLIFHLLPFSLQLINPGGVYLQFLLEFLGDEVAQLSFGEFELFAVVLFEDSAVVWVCFGLQNGYSFLEIRHIGCLFLVSLHQFLSLRLRPL